MVINHVLDVVACRLTAMYLLSTTKQAIQFKSSTKQRVLLYTSLGGVNNYVTLKQINYE
jgi:hypothetical protein